MKRPSFQFYPADWRNNAKLRRCSHAARGAWVDILGILHDSDEYGVLRWPLADLARAAGVPIKLARELADKDVLKGGDHGCPAYIYTPRHAGKDGEPVTLLEATSDPCWYCSRFVRDEHVRQNRGKGSRFTEDEQPERPKRAPKTPPKPPLGDAKGDGSTSSSTSSSKRERESVREARGENPKPPPAGPDPTFEKLRAVHARFNAPVLDPRERRAYGDNREVLDSFTDDDWQAIGELYRAFIPEGSPVWRPDQRLAFITTANDVRSGALHWRGKKTGIVPTTAPAIPADFVDWLAANYTGLNHKTAWISGSYRSEWEQSQRDNAA